MSTTEMKFDLYQTVTDRIITLLEAGTIPWRKPWSSAGPPMNAITKRSYQGINLWLLLTLPYGSNLFLTWDQLKRAGGSVVKGETGHFVVYWQVDDQNMQQAEPDTQKKKIQMRYHKVFNVEQCTGLPPAVLESHHERQLDPLKACEHIIVNMPNKPRIFHGKRRASYEVATDYLNMPNMKNFESSEAYYCTFYHELIHSTGHEKRLARKTITEMAEFGSPPYSNEELIAELGSCYLCAHAGILPTEIQNSAAYIKGWLDRLTPDSRVLITSSTAAQKAADYILNKQSSNEKTGST